MPCLARCPVVCFSSMRTASILIFCLIASVALGACGVKPNSPYPPTESAKEIPFPGTYPKSR